MILYRPGDTYYGLLFTDVGGDAPEAFAVRNGVDDPGFVLAVSELSPGRYRVSGTVPKGYAAGDVVQVWSGQRIVGEFTVDPAGLVWKAPVRKLTHLNFDIKAKADAAQKAAAPFRHVVANLTEHDILRALAAIFLGRRRSTPDHGRTDFYDPGDDPEAPGVQPRVSSDNSRTSHDVTLRGDA